MQIRYRREGDFDLTGPLGTLERLTVGVELGKEGSRRWLISRGGWWDGGTLSLPDGSGIDVTLRGEQTPEGVILRMAVTNRRAVPVVVHRIFPLLMGASPADLLPAGQGPYGVYKQGWQSWSYAGWRPLDGWDVWPKSPLTRAAHADPTWAPPAGPGRFQSEGMLMVGAPGAPAVLLAGFVAGDRMLGRVELEAGTPGGGPVGGATAGGGPVGALRAFCEADGRELAPGETLEAEPLLLALGPEREVLEAYAAAVAWAMQARVPERSPAVWCSWYYHFQNVREDDIVAAARGLAGMPVDVVQLDDGYQTAVGDWLTLNRKFPSGLPWLADQVRQRGFTPGIWLAPFIALRRSKLYREHKSWFVRDARGKPVTAGWNPGWKDVFYALDTTQPEVQSWLADLVNALVGAGFRYLKLDFLYAACVPGERFDPTASRAAALRIGLETVRQAAGADVFLLGCGSPMLPAVGLVDAMRVGPDVAPSWRYKFLGVPALGEEPGTPAARNALQGAVGRQWMHGRLWANDPDSVIFRAEETELSPEEARTLVAVAALSGGVFSFSDPPERISPERMGWLRRTLPVAPGFGFHPTTYLEAAVPFLSVARSGDWVVVLALNAGEAERPLALDWAACGLDPATACHVCDAWSGEYLGAAHGACDAGTVPPHGSRVLTLKPVGAGPEVVGTTYHLAPSAAIAASRWDGESLTVALAPAVAGRATVTVWTAGRTVAAVTADGARVVADRCGPGETYCVELATEHGGTFRIDCR